MHFFGKYGLLVLIPDNAALKKIIYSHNRKKEITQQFSHHAVRETINALEKNYKVQAEGRALNLFYLLDNKRERIEKKDELFVVESMEKTVDKKKTIFNELHEHPERFSGNVMLRGVFQETVLPNIVFIGGGGELAYWLELKKFLKQPACLIPCCCCEILFYL